MCLIAGPPRPPEVPQRAAVPPASSLPSASSVLPRARDNGPWHRAWRSWPRSPWCARHAPCARRWRAWRTARVARSSRRYRGGFGGLVPRRAAPAACAGGRNESRLAARGSEDAATAVRGARRDGLGGRARMRRAPARRRCRRGDSAELARSGARWRRGDRSGSRGGRYRGSAGAFGVDADAGAAGGAAARARGSPAASAPHDRPARSISVGDAVAAHRWRSPPLRRALGTVAAKQLRHDEHHQRYQNRRAGQSLLESLLHRCRFSIAQATASAGPTTWNEPNTTTRSPPSPRGAPVAGGAHGRLARSPLSPACRQSRRAAPAAESPRGFVLGARQQPVVDVRIERRVIAAQSLSDEHAGHRERAAAPSVARASACDEHCAAGSLCATSRIHSISPGTI